MSYKIKRPLPTNYIPLSDRIEKLLDMDYKSGNTDETRLIVTYDITQ